MEEQSDVLLATCCFLDIKQVVNDLRVANKSRCNGLWVSAINQVA